MTSNFKMAKQKADRGVSTADIGTLLTNSNYDNALVIGWNDGEQTQSGWSMDNYHEAYARISIVKQELLEVILENDGFYDEE